MTSGEGAGAETRPSRSPRPLRRSGRPADSPRPLRRSGRPADSSRLPLRKSLLVRLLAVSALVAACSVAATAWLAVQTTSGAIRQQQGQDLSETARIYDTLRGRAATHAQWAGVGPTVRGLAEETGRRIALTTPQGHPLADSDTSADPAPLPKEPSAVVNPLSADTALASVTARSGQGERTGPGLADGIDHRAVGPFDLPAAERAQLRKKADGVGACLREMGLTADIAVTAGGRPRIRIVGNDRADVLGARCGLAELDRPTRTEATALTALNKLSDDCLRRKGRAPTRLSLDLTWRDSPDHPVVSLLPREEPAPAVAPMPWSTTSTVPLPREPVEERKTVDDRAVETCVASSRAEQLGAHVSPTALLFITDPDGTRTPAFALSPANTARIVGVAALVLALTVGATLLAATRLVRPLRALTGAAQRMKDGESSRPVPVTADNEVGRLAAAFNDMAAHRATLEAQRRALVSDVAHELRTPLSNIRGWLEAAEDGIADPDPAFVSSLLEEAVQLQHIIDDLQDLAQADAGALRLRPELLRPEELLAQVAAAHQGRAETAGVTVTVARPAEAGEKTGPPVTPPPPEVVADPVRLRQAVGNLLTNAVRHTPSGGTVTLRAHQDGDRVSLSVSDTGTGIPPEDLPHVFDRFWRAEKSRSRRTGGSGLGLAIVRKLAEAHGGTIDVRSTPGQGSVFTLHLPPASASPLQPLDVSSSLSTR
ncbi:sensor histidine kinase [Streptomyces sp. NPDC057638]|uniref:sensor histidine kinase n=1 Tax=Streptomyces sp. NPDC057638 TaxID=3346190 RepID=UPI0036CA0F15